ncbi:DUF2000 domain-containing protein [Franconibacter helveticus 513]|uniref:DUF2000 domain-containing protein n=1 Tax=Franconibacter helveticus TaxID=357240 RepID=UPI000429FE94|nr:DUF2000 domain-containing protein [Franconibacter helveticus]MDU6922913.1 DUF2000 domain-containing protein [Franconibacter helveticus]
MKFDASQHKCAIIVEKTLTPGLAINAASVIGVSLGRQVDNLVGPEMQSQDGVVYPGVIYAPLPILLTQEEPLTTTLARALSDPEILVMPFSTLAQSCKTYEEYGERISQARSEAIGLAAVGLLGPKKKINKLTGHLPLYRLSGNQPAS